MGNIIMLSASDVSLALSDPFGLWQNRYSLGSNLLLTNFKFDIYNKFQKF